MLYIYIYIYIVLSGAAAAGLQGVGGGEDSRSIAPGTDNLRTKTLDFRGFDSSRILSLRGQRESPGNFESTNLSRDTLSREIGRRLEHAAG